MDEFIARANIEHLRKLLEKETDEGRRRSLQKMIEDEKEKLNAALQRKQERA